jgi:hypothetical protein
VRALKEKGFNLEAIAHLVERASGDWLEALDFTRAVVEPLATEEPEVVTTRVFAERWGPELTPELAKRAIELGFVRRVGEDQWEIRSPRLDRAAGALSELGVPLEAALEVAATLRRSARAAARTYVELFMQHVWEPFETAGEPKEDWPKVRAALDRLQPMAGESLLAVFQLAMAEQVERVLAEKLAERA